MRSPKTLRHLFLTAALLAGVPCFAADTSTAPTAPASPVQDKAAAAAEKINRVWQQAPAELRPQRIVLNVTEDLATSIAVTWRTAAPATDSYVEYAPATPGTSFAEEASRLAATTEVFNDTGGTPAHQHAAVLTGLRPGTRYCYRVGSPGALGPWTQFTTTRADDAPVSFVWFGDPQDDIAEHCTRIFAEALRTAPSASVWLCTGDLCTDPIDWLWGELLETAAPALRTIAFAAVPGNHDTAYKEQPTEPFAINSRYLPRDASRVGSPWRPHFTLPANGPAGLEETCYAFDVQGVRVLMLNSNTRLDEQLAWARTQLGRQPSPRWTILAFHHPVYSGSPKRDKPAQREMLQAFCDEQGVDLVLTGHDHVYLRSLPLRAGKPAAPGERATTYLSSVSGPKFYKNETPFADLMAKRLDKAQLFQVINIAGKRLDLTTHAADGSVVDSLTLHK